MSLTEKVNIMARSGDLKHIENLLSRIEKFDSIKPEETIWSEQRLMQNIRTLFHNENNAYYRQIK